MRILVVDDELVSRNKMKKMLGKFGKCEVVERGSAAITAFKNAWENWRPFDLITLDITMPEMDGKKVLSEIRRIEEENKVPGRKQVKILMVTAHSDPDTVMSCAHLGCDDYLLKPFSPHALATKLKELGFEVD
ncbi:MAG: response regulator [Desulfobacterales bacterium]|nr:response regulator [Desulfobacterales bacterium]